MSFDRARSALNGIFQHFAEAAGLGVDPDVLSRQVYEFVDELEGGFYEVRQDFAEQTTTQVRGIMRKMLQEQDRYFAPTQKTLGDYTNKELLAEVFRRFDGPGELENLAVMVQGKLVEAGLDKEVVDAVETDG